MKTRLWQLFVLLIPFGLLLAVISATTTPQRAAATTPIRHVVILYQENHTFNQLMAQFCISTNRCVGTMNGRLPDGSSIALRAQPDLVPEVVHIVKAQQTAIDGGKMDGWVKVYGCGPKGDPAKNHVPYGCLTYVPHTQMNNVWAFAQRFAISDRTFEMTCSPSWGGHLEIAAATTDRFTGDIPLFTTPAHITGLQDGPGWGCNSNKDTDWVNPTTGVITQEPACIPARDGTGPYRPSPATWVPTIMDRLQAAGLSWKIYAPSQSSGWSICPVVR